MFLLSIKALKANRLKTFLIFVSLVFSVTSIFLVSSISNGIISMYSNLLKSDGDIIITQAKISDTFFSNVDISLIKKINKIENVKKASAIIVGASPVQNLPIAPIYGVTKNRFSNYSLVKGSYPKLHEAIIGKSIYDSLSNKKLIQIANKKFSISGVFKSDIGFENGGVVLNIKDASSIFNKSASMIMVNTYLNKDTSSLVKKISILDKNIDVKSTQSFVNNYNQFKIIQTSSNLIGFISFFLGILSIVSIITITVNQRKSEFGIKRAIGISTKNIITQIVLENLILGIVSFIVSFFISYFCLLLIKDFELFNGYVNGQISLKLALALFICSLSMSILGAIIPAINASKIDPVNLIQGDRI